MRVLLSVSSRIGHAFDDLMILDRALTHASLGNEGHPSYERLEFLGDSILGFIVADSLYGREPEVPEGELTDRRARLVSREPLAQVAARLNLVDALSVGRGLRQAELESPRILADIVEAVLGAVYVDGGIRAARKFVRNHILSGEADEPARHRRDPKSRLLHLAQSLGRGQPEYSTLSSEGPDHCRTFTLTVTIGGEQYGIGEAQSKQAAEMNAARQALVALRDELDRIEERDVAGDAS